MASSPRPHAAWPPTLAAAEALRTEKRQAMEVLFRRVQALQQEMKEVEQELLSLDDHIDALEEAQDAQEARGALELQQQPQQQKAHPPPQAQHLPHHSTQQRVFVKSEPLAQDASGIATAAMSSEKDPPLVATAASSLSQPYSPSEILTDPHTQATQLEHIDEEISSATPFAHWGDTRTRIPSSSSSAVKPAPLILSRERQPQRRLIQQHTAALPRPFLSSSASTSLSPTLSPPPTSARVTPEAPNNTGISISSGAGDSHKNAETNHHRHSASSTSVPVSTDHPLRAAVHRLLRQSFGLQSFRHSQEDIIYATLDKYDTFVVMRTGGGKSLTYQLPALLQRPQHQITLVVSPLLSLIHDQEVQMNRIAPGAAVSFTSGLGSSEHARRWDSVRRPGAGVCLVLVTPEKVHKSTKLRNELQKLHLQGRLARFVIDEAHCASQWGISFRPDYAQLGILKRHFPSIPVLAVTATASERVRRDVCDILGLDTRKLRLFRSTANRPNLRYAIRPKPDAKNAVIADMAAYIQMHHPTDSGIIYTLSRKEVDAVADALANEYEIPAAAYHSDVSTTEKEHIHQEWMQNRCQVVVATIAFGLGINKPDVRFVLHHCISKNLDSYYQESGRAGRDGEPADCILYYGAKDVPRMRAMVHDTPGGSDALMPMVRYAQTFGNDAVCRAILLSELGEPGTPSPEEVMQREGDATTDFRDVGQHAQTITRLVYQAYSSGEAMTMAMLIKAWRATKDVLDIVAACPPKGLTTLECEVIIVALLLQNVLRFHVHWTAYQAVAYIQPGPNLQRFLLLADPVVRVRFPRVSKKPAAVPKKSAAATTRTKKTKVGKKKAVAAKKKRAVAKKKGTKAKRRKPPSTTTKRRAKAAPPKRATLDQYLVNETPSSSTTTTHTISTRRTVDTEVIVLSSDDDDDDGDNPVDATKGRSGSIAPSKTVAARKRLAAPSLQTNKGNDTSSDDSLSDEEYEFN